jgi:hypothetical protein
MLKTKNVDVWTVFGHPHIKDAAGEYWSKLGIRKCGRCPGLCLYRILGFGLHRVEVWELYQ